MTSNASTSSYPSPISSSSSSSSSSRPPPPRPNYLYKISKTYSNPIDIDKAALFFSDPNINIYFDYDIETPKDIAWGMNLVLKHQHLLEKIASPTETQQWGWTYEKLQEFKIDVNEIDRLYYMRVETIPGTSIHQFHLVARVFTNTINTTTTTTTITNEEESHRQSSSSPSSSLPIYVELWAKRDQVGFHYPGCLLGCHGCGYVFITKDIEIFTKLILSNEETRKNIPKENLELMNNMLKLDAKYNINNDTSPIISNEASTMYHEKNRCNDDINKLPTREMKDDPCVMKRRHLSFIK